MNKILFQIIGFFSTVGVGMVLCYILPGAMRGDFQAVRNILEHNPGLEPFLIFMAPGMLLASVVWTWKTAHWFINKPKNGDNL